MSLIPSRPDTVVVLQAALLGFRSIRDGTKGFCQAQSIFLAETGGCSFSNSGGMVPSLEGRNISTILLLTL